MIGVVLICASCGGSDEKRPSLEQTRAAIEVRDAWRDELKPVEITTLADGRHRLGCQCLLAAVFLRHPVADRTLLGQNLRIRVRKDGRCQAVFTNEIPEFDGPAAVLF